MYLLGIAAEAVFTKPAGKIRNAVLQWHCSGLGNVGEAKEGSHFSFSVKQPKLHYEFLLFFPFFLEQWPEHLVGHSLFAL